MIALCHNANDVFDEILSQLSNDECLRFSDTGAVTFFIPILISECKQPWVLFEMHKIGFRGNQKHTKWC